MNETLNKFKYYDYSVIYYNKIKNNKLCKLSKKLFFSTQLTGPHIDFYHNPYSPNKNTPFKNYKKFLKLILKSINNLAHCEKYKLYLNKITVDCMIGQINFILNESNSYWENYNYDQNTILNIHKVYNMYKLFLETYSIKIPNEKSNNSEHLYTMILRQHLSINVQPKSLQQFGILKAKQLINKIQLLHNDTFNNVFEKYKKMTTSISSESHLLSLTMNNIMDNYEYCKNNFPSEIVVPEPHTIKLKWIPDLKSQYSSKAKVSGRSFFLNKHLLNFYTQEQLSILCSHETIPGHIMFRTNTNKFIDKYFSASNHSKYIKKMIRKGVKSVNEGFAAYSEKIITTNNIDKQTFLLFNKLFHAIRVILDVGLNSKNANILTIEQSRSILKQYTFLSDSGISAEINRYYANPGQACSYCVGNSCYESLEKKYLDANLSLNDFYLDMYSLQLPMNLIFKFVNEKLNY